MGNCDADGDREEVKCAGGASRARLGERRVASRHMTARALALEAAERRGGRFAQRHAAPAAAGGM